MVIAQCPYVISDNCSQHSGSRWNLPEVLRVHIYYNKHPVHSSCEVWCFLYMVWMRAQCNQGGKGVEGKGRAEFNVHMRFPSPETVKDDPEILTKPVWHSSTNAQKERNKQWLKCHMQIRTLGECDSGWQHHLPSFVAPGLQDTHSCQSR